MLSCGIRPCIVRTQRASIASAASLGPGLSFSICYRLLAICITSRHSLNMTHRRCTDVQLMSVMLEFKRLASMKRDLRMSSDRNIAACRLKAEW